MWLNVLKHFKDVFLSSHSDCHRVGWISWIPSKTFSYDTGFWEPFWGKSHVCTISDQHETNAEFMLGLRQTADPGGLWGNFSFWILCIHQDGRNRTGKVGCWTKSEWIPVTHVPWPDTWCLKRIGWTGNSQLSINMHQHVRSCKLGIEEHGGTGRIPSCRFLLLPRCRNYLCCGFPLSLLGAARIGPLTAITGVHCDKPRITPSLAKDYIIHHNSVGNDNMWTGPKSAQVNSLQLLTSLWHQIIS